MEEQRQTEEPEPRFDRTQAEEALLIAARLQQEHRDQLSLSDLKKTAAEVDISPEFVEQAIRMVQRKEPVANVPKPATPLAPTSSPGQLPVLAHLALGLFVVPAEFFLTGLGTIPMRVALAWPLALALVGLVAWNLPRGRSATKTGAAYLAVGLCALTVFVYLEQTRTFESHTTHALLGLMAVLQVAVFCWVRWLVDRPGQLAPPQASPSTASQDL